MKLSNIDKAIAELMAKREPLQQQVDAITLAIMALRDQQAKKPTPKPRKPRYSRAVIGSLDERMVTGEDQPRKPRVAKVEGQE